MHIDRRVKTGDKTAMVKKTAKLPSDLGPDSDRAFGHHAVRLGELVLAQAEAALAPLELKPRAFDTMLCIRDGDGISQQDLSRKLGVYAPQMVALIDSLEVRGLVSRKVSPTDRRRHELSLTPAGAALVRKASTIAQRLEKDLFGSVSVEDRRRFEALVRRLEDAVRAQSTTGFAKP